MTWTMPRPALQLVALVIGAAALGSFTIGILSADAPAKLPGERQASDGANQAVEAQEAVPLSQERIEGPPPPPELTPEEKARIEAEAKAKQEEEARARAAAEAAAKAAPAPPSADPLGDVLEKARPPRAAQPAPPPPEEPVF